MRLVRSIFGTHTCVHKQLEKARLKAHSECSKYVKIAISTNLLNKVNNLCLIWVPRILQMRSQSEEPVPHRSERKEHEIHGWFCLQVRVCSARKIKKGNKQNKDSRKEM